MGESKHPWRTPTVVLMNSPSWPFKRTALLELSYSAWMAWTSPSSVLKLLRTCHRPACQSLLDTFLKSMKLWNRLRWCCRCFSMMTIEDLFYCAQAWSKTCLFFCQQSLGLELVEDKSDLIMLGWLIRLMVWSFWHCLRLPFFGKGITSNWVHSFGHSFVSQIFLHITVRTVIVASPPFLSNSEGMLSTPGDFPAFRQCKASSTSSLCTGRFSGSCVCSGYSAQALVHGLVTLQ